MTDLAERVGHRAIPKTASGEERYPQVWVWDSADAAYPVTRAAMTRSLPADHLSPRPRSLVRFTGVHP